MNKEQLHILDEYKFLAQRGEIVDRVGEEAGDVGQLELAKHPPKKIPKLILENNEFLERLEEVKTAEDYCLLMEEFGREHLLTPHQVISLNEEKGLANFELLRDIVIELVEQLATYQ